MRWTGTAVIATGVLALAGCSGEDLAERVIEDRIEAESGEDVDIDFDDGDFSIRTEDGEITFDADADGNVSISGSSEDGEFSIESEDGETVIESEDGSATISSSGDLPDGFPASVPLPDGLTILVSQALDTASDPSFIVTGSVDDGTAAAQAYVEQLEAAGFEQIQFTETPDLVFFGYDDGEHYVGGSAATDGTFNLSVGPSQQG